MKKNLLLYFSLLLFHAVALAASNHDLAASLIPDSLLHGANSVVRLSETTITVSSPSKVVYEIHDIVTVLNESGAQELSQTYSYNQFSKIEDFHASIYDKEGKLMNKHGLSDMKDYSLYDGFSLFNDARFKHIQTNGGQYPITIDRTVKLRFDGIIDLPDWYIQKPDQSVENTSLTLEIPKGFDIYFKSYNSDIKPMVISDKAKMYTWSASGLKPFKTPADSYNDKFYCPYVDLSPSSFEIAGYKGSLGSWSAFGTALAAMWKDKRILPDDVSKEIKSMVKGARTDREKIDILYSYLQKNFHYVSVQIGIGGWIPFDAATVHSVRYGDCKALSNYMCAILDVVGVRSHPVLINAGPTEHSIDTSFPSNHFNHAILCAEADGKPLWLECTSSSMPLGELGTFTENRSGLMIGDSTGMVVCTPISDPEFNTVYLSHEVRVTDGGKADITGRVGLSGEYRLHAKTALIQGTDKEREAYLFTTLKIRQPGTYKLLGMIDSAGSISAQIAGSKDNLFDFQSGNKSFLPSSFIGSWYKNISVANDRKDDLLMDFPYSKSEKLVYHISGSSSISLPGDFDFDNGLVYFHRKTEKSPDNTVAITTVFKMKRHIIHPAEIALLKESLQKVNKYLQQKVILESK